MHCYSCGKAISQRLKNKKLMCDSCQNDIDNRINFIKELLALTSEEIAKRFSNFDLTTMQWLESRVEHDKLRGIKYDLDEVARGNKEWTKELDNAAQETYKNYRDACITNALIDKECNSRGINLLS